MRNETLIVVLLASGLLAYLWSSTLSAQTVNDFGFAYTPLGQATVTVSSTTGNVDVGNLGSSGQDGVSIDLSGVQNPTQQFFGLDTAYTLGGTPITGSSITSTVTGWYGGQSQSQPAETLSSLTTTLLADGDTQISATFPPLSGQPVTINYYTGGPGGTLVYSENGGTGGAAITVRKAGGYQDTSYTDLNYPNVDNPNVWTTGSDFSSAVGVTTAGGTELEGIDFIDFGASNSLVPTQYSADEMTVGGGGINSLQITGEAVTVPEPSTITLLLASAACLLGFAWRRRKGSS